MVGVGIGWALPLANVAEAAPPEATAFEARVSLATGFELSEGLFETAPGTRFYEGASLDLGYRFRGIAWEVGGVWYRERELDRDLELQGTGNPVVAPRLGLSAAVTVGDVGWSLLGGVYGHLLVAWDARGVRPGFDAGIFLDFGLARFPRVGWRIGVQSFGRGMVCGLAFQLGFRSPRNPERPMAPGYRPPPE